MKDDAAYDSNGRGLLLSQLAAPSLIRSIGLMPAKTVGFDSVGIILT